MNKIKTVVSPIAIDMGAKNTGIYLNHFEQGECPTTSRHSIGQTLVIDGNNITWPQKSRTDKRHQVRTGKRRKLAKRLLHLILQQYKFNLDQKQIEFLNGLMNRRGYTYLVDDLDESLVNQPIVAGYFCDKFPEFFQNESSFYNDFLNLSNDINQVHTLLSKLTLSKNKAKKEIDEKGYQQAFSDAYDNIKKALATQVKSEEEGHKYRKKYLENIYKDISESILLKPLFSKLSAKDLTNLIGNISNLQLRVLRKYFNDESMKTGDIWIPEKLHQKFFKWVRSWHSKQDNEKRNRIDILQLQKNGQDILEILTTLDPIKTIPPYEDQNNRRPPKDKTLRLKPASLDKVFPEWEKITHSLIQNYCLPPIKENHIDKINITENLEKSTLSQKGSHETKERQKLANTLHRILDRTIILDPYKLRWQADSLETPYTKKAKQLLNEHSQNQANIIIEFAKKYYQEVEIAKQGLWSDNEQTLFFCCNTNPPQKGNIQHKLISHILREDFSPERLERFINECWNQKINRSTMKSLAGKIEATRKNYGNGFNYIVRTIQSRQYIQQNKTVSPEQLNRWEKYEQAHSDVMNAIKDAELISSKISIFLAHDKQIKYNNPFSIAQLYNILETERTGFSKTDRFNTEENAWRDQEETVEILNKQGQLEKRTASNAVRLASDSIRPFDGMLARILDRQAYEIASMKIKQIDAANLLEDEVLFVPIIMEQNRFKFEQGLAEVKANSKKKNEAVDKLQKQQERWKTKTDRIQKNTICPYTGKMIGKGEIDHIIPRSQSRNRGNVVYNSEANLIYCSGTGNQQKGATRYTFEQLNKNYLKEIFETTNTEDIKQKIISYVKELDTNDSISFQNLEETEQNYLRHALFIEELDNFTYPLLNTRFKTLVNGTQSYLGKKIRKILQEKYPNIKVRTYQIDAQNVSHLRTTLGHYDEQYIKQDKQGAFSHVIDAALVFATALQNEKISTELQTVNTIELSEHGEWLSALIPTDGEVKHIKRKPKYRKKLQSTQIFKEGIYGERFIPILLKDKEIFYGFSFDNCIKIKPNKKQGFTTLEDYFELLKPFLYTGNKNNKKPVDGTLSDNQSYQYLSIDKTKAIEFLQRCTKQVCSEVETQQEEQLKKLRYSVEKKEIKSLLLTGTGKRSFIKQLETKKFNLSGIELPAKLDWLRLINYPIKNYCGDITTLQNCFGQPEQIETENPKMVGFWEKLSNESGLEIEYLKQQLLKRNDKGMLAKKLAIIPKTVFDKKIKEEERLKKLENSELLKANFGVEFTIMTDLIPQQSWKALFNEFFHTNKIQNPHAHKQVRKIYSLPIVSAPSGGFRIKRINPVTNKSEYQVSGIEGFATKGYDKLLKTPALIDQLEKSKNIAPLEPTSKVEDVCYFDNWKRIKLPDGLDDKLIFIEYAIGSKDRFTIRVCMKLDQLMALDKTLNSFSNIPPEIKEGEWKFKKTKLLASELLGKPRSNLFIEKVNQTNITFSYIVESTNSAMKLAYQNGTAVNE